MLVNNEILGPVESATIKELSLIIKQGANSNLFSDKEFEEFILSRRPTELMLIAQMALTNLDSVELPLIP